MPSQPKTLPKRLKIGSSRPIHDEFKPYTQEQTVVIQSGEVGHALRH